MSDCSLPVRSKGLCNKHYLRGYFHGDPSVILDNTGKSPLERFLLKVNQTVGNWQRTGSDVCWLWTGTVNARGYGMFYPGGDKRMVAAHRWSYEHYVGPIPVGLELDHLCRVRHCVNPEHLEPVTAAENRRRSPLAPEKRTHCPQGHPYDEVNTYVRPKGGRICRICVDASRKRYVERQRAARGDRPE